MKTAAKGAVPVTAIVILLALSTVSVFGSDAFAVSVNTVEMGNFSLGVDQTTSTLYNLTYSNENVSVLGFDKAVTEGKYSSLAPLGHRDVAKTVLLNNVTLFATEDGDMFLMSTTDTVATPQPSISLHLPSSASVVTITDQAKNSFKENGNSLMSSFVSNPVYRMPVSGGYVFYFANSPSTLVSNGHTIVYQNSSFISGSSIVVGVTPSASVKFNFDGQQQYLGTDPFTYNTATGQLTGSFVSLNFDSSTGIIRDYTSEQLNTIVFTEIYSYGNGNFGNGWVTPTFPTTEPVIMGSVFYYANGTSIYQLHNNLAMVSNFLLDNGTTVFVTAAGMNATVYYPTQIGSMQFKNGHNYSNYGNLYLSDSCEFEVPSAVIEIHNSVFAGELLVRNATVDVSGNSISITTDGIAQTTFVSHPGYALAQNEVRNQFRYAMEHGMLGAIVSVGGPGFMNNNITSYYKNQFQVQIQNANQNMITLQFSAQMQQGTNVMIYVPNGLIPNGSQIKLIFDNQEMTMATNMNSVMNDSSQTDASYFMTAVNGGSVILLHIPHFSTHTLEITSTNATPTGLGGLLTWISIGVIVVAVGGIAAFVVLRNRPKSKN